MKIPKRTIWIVRHGERVDNINPDWKKAAKRWDDPNLSIRGHVQAIEVGKRLAEEQIDYALCSPFTRCVETISGIVRERKDSLPIFIEPGLGESMNACNDPPGRPTMEEICQTNSSVDRFYSPIMTEIPKETGGDAGCSFRVGYTLRKILEQNPTGNILLVSHGSPIAACHQEIFGDWNYVGQCTIGKIVQEGDKFKCEYYGSRDHLTAKTNLRDIQNEQKKNEERRLAN